MKIRWGCVGHAWPEPHTREMLQDIRSLSSFSQLTVTSELTLGSSHAQTCRSYCCLLLLWLQLCFWQEAASYRWKNIYFWFLTVSYFSKNKNWNAQPQNINDGCFSPPTSFLCTNLLTWKVFQSQAKIINSHSVVYSKNYLFWRMKLHQKKENSEEERKKSLIDIGTVRDGIAITGTPSSFANHWGLLELVANNECYVSIAGHGLALLCQAAWDILVLGRVCRHFLGPTDLVTYTLSVTELRCLENNQCSSNGNERKSSPKIET